MTALVHRYPSFIAGLRYYSPDGLDRGRYCAHHLRHGDLLILTPEPNNPYGDHAVRISPASAPELHLGYIPHKHPWVFDAIGEGSSVDAIVESIWTFGWFRWRRAYRVSIQVRLVRAHHKASRQRAEASAFQQVQDQVTA
jgi:HIRAN domain